MTSMTDFPTKLITDNIAFGRDNTVWAYFEIPGFGYDHRDDRQKEQPFYNQMTFLTKNAFDIHYLLIPYQMDGSDVITRTIESVEGMQYALRNSGLEYLKKVRKVMEKGEKKSSRSQYHGYFGVQLDARNNRHKEGNRGTELLATVRGVWDGVKSPVRNAVGLEPYDILQSELDQWKDQAAALKIELSEAFSCAARELTTGEMLFVTEYGFKLSSENKTTNKELVLAESVEGKDKGGIVKALRPNKQAYYELQDALIDPTYSGRTLKIQKVIDGEEREELVRYLVVDRISSKNYHPGFEWVYQLQTNLNFPIGLSIRAHHKPNRNIRKELSNALLTFDDQREQAKKGKVNMDRSVSKAEEGAINMEEVFQKSGHPAYACSFVIRLTADDENELRIRERAVRSLLDKHKISFQSPYGDGKRYMMEFIPGGKRITDDYWINVSPGILASMLFGATTNIGDNQGFLIGYTKKFKKPVFLQPDLAAQNLDYVKNLFDSLSVVVVGETGKGKSVFMNLYATISALTLGSQVLIIDPKGDRKGWANGLPFIPKEEISVWSLGASSSDAGSLDPFRTSVSIAEAKNVTMDILTYLCEIGLKDPKYSLLSQAIEVAGEHRDPCIQVAINHLKDTYENPPKILSEKRKEALEDLIGLLESLQMNKLAGLLFGEIGQEYRTLSVEKSIQVVMVQNLLLPDKNKKNKRAAEKISEAILISLTAFTRQFIFNTDKNRHKLILQDEAKTIENSEMGRELLDWIERNGRHYNTSLLKGSQNASDYQSAANIGMKVSFNQQDEKEAERMLGFFNLPVTRSNVQTIQRLKRGECMFQDIYGRTAVIEVSPIFQEILDAFDTSTITKEEREAKNKKHSVGV